MFVSKRSKKRFWNNSFSNRLWLATVIVSTFIYKLPISKVMNVKIKIKLFSRYKVKYIVL